MRENDGRDIGKADADLLELPFQLVMRLDHRRRIPARPDKHLVAARAVSQIRFVETRIEQHPALTGVEQVGRDRYRDDEPRTDVAGRYGLGNDLEAAEENVESANARHVPMPNRECRTDRSAGAAKRSLRPVNRGEVDIPGRRGRTEPEVGQT